MKWLILLPHCLTGLYSSKNLTLKYGKICTALKKFSKESAKSNITSQKNICFEEVWRVVRKLWWRVRATTGDEDSYRAKRRQSTDAEKKRIGDQIGDDNGGQRSHSHSAFANRHLPLAGQIGVRSEERSVSDGGERLRIRFEGN
jgi:hypothetical protein